MYYVFPFSQEVGVDPKYFSCLPLEYVGSLDVRLLGGVRPMELGGPERECWLLPLPPQYYFVAWNMFLNLSEFLLI